MKRIFERRLGPVMTALTVSASFVANSVAASLNPVALHCEYRVSPLGIDEAQPRLTWRVESSERGQKQTACQILVASSEALLRKNTGDLWDSGKITTDQTVNLTYAGKPLAARQACFWKVRVRDKNDRATWSQPASWTMGLLQPDEWQADYLSYRDTAPVFKDPKNLFLPPAHQYRKEFAAAKPVRSATLYATALGIYELYFNGERVGDALFAPGWTDYRQRAYYWTYDVTPLVRRGENALEA